MGKEKSSDWVKDRRTIYKAVSFLLLGGWRKYKPIAAADVAKSMVAAANKEVAGVHMYEYDEMRNLMM